MQNQLDSNSMLSHSPNDIYPIFINLLKQHKSRGYLQIFPQYLQIAQERLNLHDLIGLKQTYLQNDFIKLTLNAFIKDKKCLRPMRRYLHKVEFYVKMEQRQLQLMKIHLMTLIHGRKLISSKDQPQIMLYFNPNAGGNSRKHLQNVINFLGLTNFTFQLLVTQGRGHCAQHLSTLPLKQFDSVAIISGDGLMHQFVNSLVATEIPVTHVPAGSGNAFAKTQTELANEDCRDQQSIFLIIKGRKTTFNLIKIQLEHVQRPLYSFLSLQWAFLADVDMNSQWLRCLGGLRFELYSYWRTIALRRYRGKLTISQYHELPPLHKQIPQDQSFVTMQTQFLHILLTAIPYITQKHKFSPLLEPADEVIDLQFITSEQGRFQLAKYLLKAQSGSHFNVQKRTLADGHDFNHHHIKSFRLEPNGENRGIFGIDGESYESQKIQGTMCDRKINTFI